MDQKRRADSYSSGKLTQHTEDKTSVLSSAYSDGNFQRKTKEVEESALVDLTLEDEEGALEELLYADMVVENEDSYKEATMEDHKGTPAVDLYVDEGLRPKELPRIDVHVDEENIETDAEGLDQEAPVPRPFDLDEENIKTDEKTLEQEAIAPKSDQTAENGWIVILENPKVPYDQDADPAGLYGGREVDDRPSLLEFYHQDARTNGYFAKMAPTKAELEAKTAAAVLAKRMIEASGSVASNLQTAPTISEGSLTGNLGILKLRPPTGDIPSPPKRSYADVLTGISGTTGPSNQANPLPFRSTANVSFSPGTKKESAREKAEYRKAVLDGKQDERSKDSRSKSDDGGPLLRTKPIREWVPHPTDKSRRFLRITNVSTESDADDEQDIAKPTVESDDDSDLEKAIAASLEHETQPDTVTELKENTDPDIPKSLNGSIALDNEANANFQTQFAEVNISMAMMEEEKAYIDNAIIHASKAEEEAGLERAIWASMKESPDKKRKCSSQSFPDDGGSEGAEIRTAERGWMTPKGGEKRSCKRLSSPKKVAGR